MTNQNTRPQPSAEPVAVWREAYTRFNATIAMTNEDGNQAAAAVIASALEAARREALAPRGAFAVSETVSGGQWSATLHFGPDAEAMQAFADAVRSALKENPNG